ncbi:hypothetical protein [Chryseobacterium sp. ERMR1:04]|uniref:hypothetical protein n=1 Tax=Chryseobacterium sp. ERMR1:04 TaxID=1705393 RepID=UPI0006C8A2B7|nr:hypothetical protein [Chryseobacterium sp. ERMR1:04]KPH11889.1 hypothetical protein AMQ68_21295 [Chryseobacterium sp. ERMR1:04]
MSENYLQKAWGDSIDNVNINDIKEAINEALKMDDEHGVFWVSIIIHDENVLEMSKNLDVTGIFEDNNGLNYKRKFKNIKEIISLYEVFLTEDFASVKSILKEKI